MKVITAKGMADLESLAYKEGYSEEAFMEKAGKGISQQIEDFTSVHQLQKHILLLCGKGNNGGDAYVAGCYLLQSGFAVSGLAMDPIDQCSPLCQKNRHRFLDLGGVILSQTIQDFSSYSLIVDGLFGTGFKGTVKEPYASIIDAANTSKKPILAIDIPSGLDGSTGEAGSHVIVATETLALGLPKTGFFLKNGWNYVGRLRVIKFGLPKHLIDAVSTNLEMTTETEVLNLLPPIKRNRHKYEAGEVVGLSGSPGMPGAALLASFAALRSGCGMMKLLYPKGMEIELAKSPFEVIKVPYSYENVEKIISLLNEARANFIGPGIGRHKEMQELLQKIMPALTKPCVIDADALFLYSQKPFSLPKNVLFTPHKGEMQKLLKTTSPLDLTMETLSICQKYTEDHKITLILKGAPTFIFHPCIPIRINCTGDPGMATAGSGDVLTGILAGLLAQGLTTHQAAILGVYLHGLAGEWAAQEKTSYSMIASDIIFYLPQVFKSILSN